MNRIEEIKERLEVGEYTEYGYQTFYAREDIQYLLSKLEKMDTWLSDIVHIGKSDPEYALKVAQSYINKLRED